MQTNPRIPADEQEVFPDQIEWSNCPDFVSPALAHMWKRGYDCGVAFFSDHALDWEE